MKTEREKIDEEIGELLSGYIDGELTQQQRQRVDVYCDRNPECRKLLDEMIVLRRDVGDAMRQRYGDGGGESMQDDGVKLMSGIGWVLLIGGAVSMAGLVLHAFLFDPGMSLFDKLLFGAFYGGLGMLFAAVLRQRLIERKTDKYKDVEI